MCLNNSTMVRHRKGKTYSDHFWNEVDMIVPNSQKQVQWLKEYGAGLDV